jgi:hypothetical protein
MAVWLSDNRREASRNEEWLSSKLLEIPAWLKKLEHTEFNRTFLDSDFDGVNDYDFDDTTVFQEHQTPINQITAVGRHYGESQLPKSLRLAAPTGNANGTGNGTRRRDMLDEFAANPRDERRPRREERGPGPRNDRPQPVSDDKHNPNFHPKLKAFWEGVEVRHQDAKLSDLCHASGQHGGTAMNVTKLTEAMGLNATNCGAYYVKGKCRTIGCNKDHALFHFEGAKIDAAIVTLKRGCANYRGSRANRGRS